MFETNKSKQLINYINDNNLVDVYQSAYKKGHNTETALLSTMNDIYFSLDKYSRIQLLQLDLSSAFDSISHDILIDRLSQIGITRDALKILIQLIKDRTYSFKIHDCILCENISLYGVPQGSTLGPLRFTIYISHLKYIIEQTPNVKYHMRMIFKFMLNLVITIN